MIIYTAKVHRTDMKSFCLKILNVIVVGIDQKQLMYKQVKKEK
jgi:hypothetical protein